VLALVQPGQPVGLQASTPAGRGLRSCSRAFMLPRCWPPNLAPAGCWAQRAPLALPALMLAPCNAGSAGPSQDRSRGRGGAGARACAAVCRCCRLHAAACTLPATTLADLPPPLPPPPPPLLLLLISACLPLLLLLHRKAELLRQQVLSGPGCASGFSPPRWRWAARLGQVPCSAGGADLGGAAQPAGQQAGRQVWAEGHGRGGVSRGGWQGEAEP
jgi:hypothetical protein